MEFALVRCNSFENRLWRRSTKVGDNFGDRLRQFVIRSCQANFALQCIFRDKEMAQWVEGFLGSSSSIECRYVGSIDLKTIQTVL